MLLCLTTGADGQVPDSAPVVDWELPADIRAALAQTRDFAFDFHQPGFYAVLEFVKNDPRSPGFAEQPINVADWRDLLERPSDFRGHPITIEGVVGSNRDPYALINRPQLGQLWQIQLQRDGQPLTCTLVFTQNSADIPLGAALTVTGYFIMIRQYHDRFGQARPAALFVAPGPTAITYGAPPMANRNQFDWRWMAGAVVVGLLITGFLMRRASRWSRRDPHVPRARHATPMNLADDLSEWAADESRDDR